MILSLRNKIDDGGYSVIIKDGNKVYKLFKNSINVNMLRSFEDDIRRLTFNAEVEAYRITQSVNALKQYVPKFFGIVTVEKVEDENCKDVSNLYLLDCCYVIEYISTKFCKINNYYDNQKVNGVLDLFRKNGIHYLHDSSISFISNTNFKIIDFAINEAYFENEMKYLSQ